MTKNKIRLLALDLDGTVLTSANTLDAEVKKAIENAVESGIEIVVASGRPFCSMPEDVLGIEGIRYIIASNGAAVYDGSAKIYWQAVCIYNVFLCKPWILLPAYLMGFRLISG